MQVKMIFAQYKVKMWHILQNMYIFCCFDEVSAIRKPKIRTSSITGSQIFFADFLFFLPKQNKIVHTGKLLILMLPMFVHLYSYYFPHLLCYFL